MVREPVTSDLVHDGIVTNIVFLFLVGLEVDAEVIKRNARLSTTVAVAGMILPFGIGAVMAYAVYKEFIKHIL